LFWTSVQRHSSASFIQRYLNDWSADIAPNDMLSILIQLPFPVPDNLADFRGGGLTDDESLRIEINVHKKIRDLKDEPVVSFGSVTVSVPLGKSPMVLHSSSCKII
jgi:hypothetical protein